MNNSEELIHELEVQYLSMSAYEKKAWQEGHTLIAGVDEAGRGPLAGPVVAAACILNRDCPILGLNDSKKLSEKKREELYAIILKKAVCFSVMRIEPDVVDEINILAATKRAMIACIRSLAIRPDKVLLDAVMLDDDTLTQESIIKGDSLSVSIAAASILAKVTRDKIMKAYDIEYPGYGFARHKGYPTRSHYEAIRQLGITPIHRRTFLKGMV